MGIGVILSLISGLHHRKDIAAPAAPSPSDTNEKTEGE